MQRHPNINKLHLEGIRLVKVKELFEAIRSMPMLLDLKVSLAESAEVKPMVIRLDTQKVMRGCLSNKRAMALIQSMYMHGHIAQVGARLIS